MYSSEVEAIDSPASQLPLQLRQRKTLHSLTGGLYLLDATITAAHAFFSMTDGFKKCRTSLALSPEK